MPTSIIHEYGEIWVEQGFSPAFTVLLELAALAAEVHTVRNSGIASGAKEAAEKSLLRGCHSEGVILSEAKDLLFAHTENKADPSIAQNRRDLRMTLP